MIGAALLMLLASQANGPAPQVQEGERVYLDSTAERLVEGLIKARRGYPAIDAYTATVRERMRVDIATRGRNRKLLGGEFAARVRWSRDGRTLVKVLGSRFRTPSTGPAGQPELLLGSSVRRMNPLRDPFRESLLPVDTQTGQIESPLGEARKRYYQYRTSDSLTIALMDGRTVTAIKVEALPRLYSIHLVKAMLWIDAESHDLVRVAWRLAKAADSELKWGLRREGSFQVGLWLPKRDSTPPKEGKGTRFLNWSFNRIAGPVRMDVASVVVDYALWEMRYWLPRRVEWHGYMEIGDRLRGGPEQLPVYPYAYDWTYRVEDIQTGAKTLAEVARLAEETVKEWTEEGDSVARGEPERKGPFVDSRAGIPEIKGASPGERLVEIWSSDRAALHKSADLPSPLSNPYPENASGGSDAGYGDLLASLPRGEPLATVDADLPEAGAISETSHWLLDPPLVTPSLIGYNSYVGFSAGARLQRRERWGVAALTLRAGHRALEPEAELQAIWDHPALDLEAALYRRIRGAAVWEQARWGDTDAGEVSFGADSMGFFLATGGEIEFRPSTEDGRQRYLQLFAEERRMLVLGNTERRVGFRAAWIPWWGENSVSELGGGARFTLYGAAGSAPQVRATATATLVAPLIGHLAGGFEVGGAYTLGSPASSDLWRLGASGYWLRGYGASALSGRSAARARADLSYPVRFLRPAIFADWARAGGQEAWSAGAGISLNNGLIRFDLARGLSTLPGEATGEPRLPGWRFHVRTDQNF